MLLLDTSAWIEFFTKNEKGIKVKSYLENKNCYTSITSIAEISNWGIKQSLDGVRLIYYVIGLTNILELDMEISFLAGQLNFQRKKIEKNWGMLDSFVLATSQINNLKVLTVDTQFKDLPNVEML